MQDQTLEKMSPQAKEWFAKAVVGMMLADGHIDKAEVDYFNDLLGFLNNDQLVKSMSEMLSRKEAPELEPLDALPNVGLEILKHLTIMAVVDQDLAPGEVTFLNEIALKLGLNEGITDRFLSLAREKLAKARYSAKIDAEEHTEQVRCFDLTETSCMFYSLKAVKPQTKVTLQLGYHSPDDPKTTLHRPVVATSTWCRPVKSRYGNYVVRARFEKNLESAQGLDIIEAIE